MSLGIAFKGPEGIVLAADSRVTLTAGRQQGTELHIIPATYDNATKLLHVNGQTFVGAVTYGLGALGDKHPRTAHSFMPEFEQELKEKYKDERLNVEPFAIELGKFFMDQWKKLMGAVPPGNEMVFLVGGIDKDSPYGKVYKITIPGHVEPEEQNPGEGNFGLVWGGQLELTTRLLKGIDPSFEPFMEKELNLSAEQKEKLNRYLQQLNLPIPYPFLPLQDCVDLSTTLIQTTMDLQNWMVGVRGVGGAIDVAIITRTNGFEPIKVKSIKSEFHQAKGGVH